MWYNNVSYTTYNRMFFPPMCRRLKSAYATTAEDKLAYRIFIA